MGRVHYKHAFRSSKSFSALPKHQYHFFDQLWNPSIISSIRFQPLPPAYFHLSRAHTSNLLPLPTRLLTWLKLIIQNRLQCMNFSTQKQPELRLWLPHPFMLSIETRFQDDKTISRKRTMSPSQNASTKGISSRLLRKQMIFTSPMDEIRDKKQNISQTWSVKWSQHQTLDD